MTALSSLASASRYAGVVLAAAALYGTIAVAAPNLVKARKHARCEQCGVIQAIRRVDAAEGRPPSYEITIRLHDGSMRTHSNATPGNWRAGDRIMLIKGGRPANEPTV